MLITESELRRIIRQVIIEEAAINEGPEFDNFMRQAGYAGAIGAAGLGAMGGMGPSAPAHAYELPASISQMSPQTQRVLEKVSRLSKMKKSNASEKDVERLIVIINKSGDQSGFRCDWDELLDSSNADRIEDLIFPRTGAPDSFFMITKKAHGRQEAHRLSLELQQILQKLHGVNRF